MHGMGIASSGIERVIAFIAIAHNNSPKVRTENIHCRTIRSVAYLKNYDVGSAKAMKVAVDSLEPPASLVCMNDISIGNLQLQNGDQAFGFVRDILGRTDNTTWRKGKTESRLKEAGNFSKWHPERVFQFGSYCDGVWPQGMVCSTQRLRCLFRMRCLDTLQATWTYSYRDAQLCNNRNDGRQVGLILTMNYHVLKITLAVRARNNRNVNNTINFIWYWLR